MSTYSLRGLSWFNALAANAAEVAGLPASVKAADGTSGNRPARFLAVVADPDNRFPRAQNGEVGLLEGWGLAHAVDGAIELDRHSDNKRTLIAIIDVPSQAYGRREEALGIHQALAGAVDAYARARLAGHPVIGLLVGKAMSGAFLAHGYQANRLIALRDPGVMVHAMGKASAARVTLRSVEELEKLAASVPPMAYDIDSYASLGLLWETLSVSQIEEPSASDVTLVQDCLIAAIKDTLAGCNDLSSRLGAPNRAASSKVRELLRAQW
ncbi:biotin-independent malonate decarboxylase subunit gamma [Pseudomonas petrae]|uniref:Biotin-independent malonate decarboxylase subunit gamma n=1 Tax=Pseudomonas petrae TaxID=2912190 RepID=A0ABS9I3V8_9PSED|nr:biotin-independent malonate decarboxylase subunit gamma [Pseudomonas petrae]MCF7533489.1 biotin-independent malonate decarboxylase subunit gamma [Pseudomonas petrae]MCF7537910.1 biotin-independent malonate decarboxylase subunit gamma [Pseudomonas petrae]MCF7542490.1 biotin-independent malonate decarboxylase subunit gamma [Pseudomonas petrae]MCF7555256.1 biotin-independent malonate decarboxylase subunit gamma [Pseudomonas petrae]